MKSPPTVQVALPVPLPGLFDYLSPENEALPLPGTRVLVPFGRRRLVGLVISRGKPAGVEPESLKQIERIFSDDEIDDELLGLLQWTTRYYAAAIGEIVTLGLPLALRRLKPFRQLPPDWLRLTDAGRSAQLKRAPRQHELQQILGAGPASRSALLAQEFTAGLLRTMQEKGLVEASERPLPAVQPGPKLNAEQTTAVNEIIAARQRFRSFLLAGVTGSGKTEVYLRAAKPMLEAGLQILILLPEIGLTPQFVRRVEARLARTAWVYHSGLSDGERLATWQAARSGQARIIIGTRSAVFLPLYQPGLIVVDEEHDSSFKQFDGVRYHARDVAVKRASGLGIPIVLGSATPSLESLHNAEQKRYELLLLSERAGQAELPHWHVEDTRGSKSAAGLTESLLAKIRARLQRGEQVLMYRNRRGYAPVLICNECGWQDDCPQCSAHLTWHRAVSRLRCHHCGYSRALPKRCPDCQSPDIHAAGSGTERIEEALAAALPQVPIVRVDRDSIRQRADFENLIEQVSKGEPCVIVGTQMIAKGHHWPGIGLSVVLDADQSLFSADFRGPERLAQTLFQVAGRAGRCKPGEFILQTRLPDHALIDQLMNGNYLDSARWLLAERAAAGLPPVHSMAMVRAEAKTPEQALDFLRRTADLIDREQIDLAGPLPALLQRRAGHWRYQLWLSSTRRGRLIDVTSRLSARLITLPNVHRVRWHIDVDPYEL
ncbi:MAG: primosomal protein N' [Pseudomonadota bacterium]